MCPENQIETGKYDVNIDQATGLVVGDYANVVQNFNIQGSTKSPVTNSEVKSAIHSASSELRNYPNEIVGIHIERQEVSQIVDWILKSDNNNKLGMIIDQPGGGKSVVMRDILEKLESKGISVLAIKSDNISGIKNHNDLTTRLALPLDIQGCAREISKQELLVVLIDQLDALSLALSRDQTTLDIILSTLARLSELDNIKIIASCRVFDLRNDPRLSKILVNHEFQLQPLQPDQIGSILQVLQLNPSLLLPAHWMLLSIPLNLEIFSRIIINSSINSLEKYRSLQDLYEALWQKYISITSVEKPSPSDHIKTIYQLVDIMQANRQLSAPISALDDFADETNYLERIGFIKRGHGNWLFFHQTLFDYCYARRFVAKAEPLHVNILSGSQGLFERSQMVQVLAYLRGSNYALFLEELKHLLFADKLRVHLRLLLLGWFGSLPDPTSEEFQIAQRLIERSEDRKSFFRVISGNLGWYELLNNTITSFLNSEDDQLVDAIVYYINSLVELRTDSVLALIKPFLGQSENWDNRIAIILSTLENWESTLAVDMVCDQLSRGRFFNREILLFHNLAKFNPEAGCKILRFYFDYRLNVLHKEITDGEINKYFQEQKLFGELHAGVLIDAAVQGYPEKFLNELLPWFIKVVTLFNQTYCSGYYPTDPFFSSGWYGDHISEGPGIALRMAEALKHVAKTNPNGFRELAKALSTIESLSVQRILIQAYLVDPLTYAYDSFNYLMGDNRRLRIGEVSESPHYDSIRLFRVAFHFVDTSHRIKLENLILGFQPDWEKSNPKSMGVTQLQFFSSIPSEDLSEIVQRKKQELERKFPGYIFQPPQGVTGGSVGPPIDSVAQAKMSDKDWLGAMHKYDDKTEWGAPGNKPLEGGVIELSRSFGEHIKDNPARFYNLAKKFDNTISLHYLSYAISGLVDANAPSEWVFDLFRLFAFRIEGHFRREICWSLNKIADDGIPDDILDITTDWASNDPDPSEERWELPTESEPFTSNNDPHHQGINSNRGAIIKFISWCSIKRDPPQFERVFQLLEQAANDPSIAVRTCVIESLGLLLNNDDERTLNIFDKTVENRPILLQNHRAHSFLLWVYNRHFSKICKYVISLLKSRDLASRQVSARIISLAFLINSKNNTFLARVFSRFLHFVFSLPPDLQNRSLDFLLRLGNIDDRASTNQYWKKMLLYAVTLELTSQCMQGDEIMRRGAAQIFARNVDQLDLEIVCKERLTELMNDSDEQVRKLVGDCFIYLRPDHFNSWRSFIEEFIKSPSFLDRAEHLIKYLLTIPLDDWDLPLRTAERILSFAGSEIVDIRTSRAILEQDLVSLPLTVYTHATDEIIKSRAIDLFERLLLLGSRTAQQALADWDRR